MPALFTRANIFGVKKPNNTDALHDRSIKSIAVLLLLVLIPHLMHLPLWVCIAAAIIIFSRIAYISHPTHRLLSVLLSPVFITLMAIGFALLIRYDYGYFVGRDPSVAFLSLLVAAKFAESRQEKDVTTLLCMAAFLLLTQYFYSQTIIAAALTLPAVVALGFCLAIARDPANSLANRVHIKNISKLLLHGAPIAALLFILFPRLPGPLWSLPEDSIATTGLSDSMTPGSIGQLTQSDAVAFRVEFDGQIPERDERYWRGPVLTEFDGRTWNVSPARMEAQPSFTGEIERELSYTVMLQPHRQNWLFALDAAISLPQASKINSPQNLQQLYANSVGQLLTDGQIVTRRPVTQLVRYHQRSVLSPVIPEPYAPAASTLFTPGKNVKTHEFAEQLRKSANSDREYANDVLRYFNQQPFYYTLKPQILGDRPIDEFLFESRAGFCEHYASAFVVLMRAAGIPARVVTGYLGGEMNGDYMIVRQSDAHAWAEAYLDGAWHRYDPTGAVAPSRIEQNLSAAIPNESANRVMANGEFQWLHQVRLRWDALNHHWQTLIVDFDNDSQDRFWEKFGLDKPVLWQISVILLVIAAAWCVFILYYLQPHQTSLSASEKLWGRFTAMLKTHNLSRRNDETPAELLARAKATWPSLNEHFNRVEQQFMAIRFQALNDSEYEVHRSQLIKQLWQLRWLLLLRQFRLQSP